MTLHDLTFFLLVTATLRGLAVVSTCIGDALDLLWGVPAISRYIERGPRATYHLLENRRLPAKKVGKVWVASKAALRSHFAAEPTPPSPSEPTPAPERQTQEPTSAKRDEGVTPHDSR